jgi:hypothetical protein
MTSHGATNGHLPAGWTTALEEIAKPAGITSQTTTDLLSRALLKPDSLTYHEIQELAASVVFYLINERSEDDTEG